MIRMSFLLAALFSISAIGNAEQLVDRIVAIVNGSPVLYSEVQEKVQAGPLVMISDFPSSERASPFERALNDAINWKIVTLKADELGIEVEDNDVDKEVEQTLKRLQLSRDGLKERLASDGVSYEDYFEDTRDFLTLRRFQGRVIQPLIKITDRDLETYYLKKSGGVSDAVELKLRQILVSLPSGASQDVTDAKQKLAQSVYQKLVDGAVFADLAKVYSDDPKARETGGLLPAMKLGDLSSKIQAEVAKIDVGQFTPPIRTSLGWHIFLLDEKKFAESKGFLSNKGRLQEELFLSEVQEQTKRWVMEQRRKSKILLP